MTVEVKNDRISSAFHGPDRMTKLTVPLSRMQWTD
jgi:hypothetical protein